MTKPNRAVIVMNRPEIELLASLCEACDDSEPHIKRDALRLGKELRRAARLIK